MYTFLSGYLEWITTRRRFRLSVISGLSLFMVVGCGGGEDASPDASIATLTVTETATTTETVTTTAFVTPTAKVSSEMPEAEESPSFEIDSGSSATTDEGPTILKPGAARDRDLDLNDMFELRGEWEQQRLDVASEVDVRSLSTEVRNCTPEDGSEIELRLANGFEKLSFSAGQANASKSSDVVVKVEVQGNDKQLDVVSVPFNQIVDLAIDVRGVNALKVFIYLEQGSKGYCEGSVIAMLYKLQLS